MSCGGNSAKFFLTPELWKVVANAFLKSELGWEGGLAGWLAGMLPGKPFRGLQD